MKVITDQDLQRTRDAAAAGGRLRFNLNVHPRLEDPVQRFFNVMEPGTYVRPHRHSDDQRWEFFLVISGCVALFRFDESGSVTERVTLSHNGPARAAEIPGNVWHGLCVLQPETVLFELKPGPYLPVGDKDFASWAPCEGSPQALEFVRWLELASIGSVAPQAPWSDG